MKYNFDYVNLKYNLINCFLLKADKTVLDISYSVNLNNLSIQVVLLEGFNLSHEIIDNIEARMVGFDVTISELFLTKEQFNESKNGWQPKYYKWLDYLLFSKAEVL